ncbi:MAG: MATE family efflux transporter [Clostridia bacterium]|nr:MATE family efflux transporter [Clostridia bacterium]
MSKFENDLSTGNVWKQMLKFSFPFVIANIIQVLYNVADMIIVGQFSGTASMSGVNIGGQITLVVTNLAIGLCVGATVLIAQYLGAKQRQELETTIGTLFSTLIIVAIILMTSIIAFKKPILRLMQTPEEAFSEASSYLTITMLGTVFIFGYNALGAIMRGMGDSKNPMIFVAISCVTNIFADLLLVAGFHMGAMGAALATVFSQAISMLLCIRYLSNNDFVFTFSKENLKINKEKLKLLLKLGIPSSIQNVVVGMSFLFLIAMANSLGLAESAAVGAVGKFNGFAIMPAIAISASVSAMSAQNIGAKEMGRAVKTLKVGFVLAAVMTFVMFLFAWFFPATILRAFVNDAAVISEGSKYLRAHSLDYLLVPFVFCFNGLFIGAGHTLFSMINAMISSIIVRIPAAYILGFKTGLGITGIGLGAPLATVLSLFCSIIFFLSGRWKKPVISHLHN